MSGYPGGEILDNVINEDLVSYHVEKLEGIADVLAKLGYADDAARETTDLLLMMRSVRVRAEAVQNRLRELWYVLYRWSEYRCDEGNFKEALEKYRAQNPTPARVEDGWTHCKPACDVFRGKGAAARQVEMNAPGNDLVGEGSKTIPEPSFIPRMPFVDLVEQRLDLARRDAGTLAVVEARRLGFAPGAGAEGPRGVDGPEEAVRYLVKEIERLRAFGDELFSRINSAKGNDI